MGQYWDEEKGTSYNYFRDYASVLGRYIQSDPIGLNAVINTYGYVSSTSLSNFDPFGLKEVKDYNCQALLDLIQYEDSIKNDFISSPFLRWYNLFMFTQNHINLNASFDSIGWKVDIDWMMRSSFPIPRIGSLGYYVGKPVWNITNLTMSGKFKDIFSQKTFMGMNEEGHKNAPLAANYYWTNKTNLKKMFEPAIQQCNCMLGNN